MSITTELLDLDPLLPPTAAIVAAHMQSTPTDSAAVGDLIRMVYNTLSSLSSEKGEPETKKPVPFVSPDKSVFPDYIICLEDGQRMKMLSGHLRRSYNMSMAEYRRKWGLPDNYPATAPAYSAKRSEMAKRIGLGKRPPVVELPPPVDRKKKASKKAATAIAGVV